MGLGKTVMMLALIHSHPKSDREKKKRGRPKKVKKVNRTDYFRKIKPHAGTLVILPVSLLSQWESELILHS